MDIIYLFENDIKEHKTGKSTGKIMKQFLLDGSTVKFRYNNNNNIKITSKEMI